MRTFCLPNDWENYRYREITLPTAQGIMHRETIIDSCETLHGIAMRLKLIPNGPIVADDDFRATDKILIFECEEGKFRAYYADIEKDRLPGHKDGF